MLFLLLAHTLTSLSVYVDDCQSSAQVPAGAKSCAGIEEPDPLPWWSPGWGMEESKELLSEM